MAETTAGAGADQLPLIWSKLQAPVARTRVSRPQLLDLLAGPARKSAGHPGAGGPGEVDAPRGLAGLEPRAAAVRLALALDEQDNDPVRFWTYAVEALHTALPGLGGSSRVLTQTPGFDPVEAMLPV